jgi:hypothetical protein
VAHPTQESIHLPELSVADEYVVPTAFRLTRARGIGSPVIEFTTVPSAEQSKLDGCAGSRELITRVTPSCAKAMTATIGMSGIDFIATSPYRLA